MGTVSTSMSRRPERGVGFSGSSSGAASASSGSAASPWCRSPRRGSTALANRKLARAGGDPLAEKRRSAGIPTFAEAAKRVIEQHLVAPSGGPSPWTGERTTRATGSCRCSAHSIIWSGTGRPCPTARWGQPSRRSGRRRRATWTRWPSSSWCSRRHGASRSAGRCGLKWTGRSASGRSPRAPLRAPARTDAAVRPGAGDSRRGPEAGLRPESDPVRRQAGKRDRRRADVPVAQEARDQAVPHGFRSSFRDWATEETDHPREVVEAALAHVVRNPVEAAYMRSDLFKRRRLPHGRLGGTSGGRRLASPPPRWACAGLPPVPT